MMTKGTLSAFGSSGSLLTTLAGMHSISGTADASDEAVVLALALIASVISIAVAGYRHVQREFAGEAWEDGTNEA